MAAVKTGATMLQPFAHSCAVQSTRHAESARQSPLNIGTFAQRAEHLGTQILLTEFHTQSVLTLPQSADSEVVLQLRTQTETLLDWTPIMHAASAEQFARRYCVARDGFVA